VDARFDLIVDAQNRPVTLHADEAVSRDVDAILTWVDSYAKESVNTRRKFRLEGLRWLAWLDNRLGGRHPDLLARASLADVTAYVAQLEHPAPVDPAILNRYGLEGSPWRGLSANSSLQVSVSILSGLYEHLRRQPGTHGGAYLSHNPFAGASRRLRTTGERSPRDRAVSRPILDEIFATIELLPRSTPMDHAHYWRCRWIFNLLYRLWLRRSEVAALTMGDFEPRDADGQGRRHWVVRVTGKGRKTA
jgi:integrase